VITILAFLTDAEWRGLRTENGEPPAKGRVMKIDGIMSALEVKAKPGEAVYLLLLASPGGGKLFLAAKIDGVERRGGDWRGRSNYSPLVDLSAYADVFDLVPAHRIANPREVELVFHVAKESRLSRDPATYVAKVPQRILKLRVAKPEGEVRGKAAGVPARRPKVAKGALAFVNRRTFDATGVLALDRTHQAQLIEAVRMHTGKRTKTIQSAVAAVMSAQGWSQADFAIDLWDVIEGGRQAPRFEYWVLGAGDGTLFTYGTARSPAAIGSTQHAFEAHGREDTKTRALVAKLQAAADRNRSL
jgi:hypothetical protein